MKKIFPWSESLKCVPVSVMEKSRIIVHLQIAVVNWKNAVENFDRHVTQTLCLFQDSRALKALVFRAACVEYPSSMLARFRVRERNYVSVRFIFRMSEVRGQPDGLSWLVKDRLTLVQLKTLNSLVCFSKVQNCYPEAFYKCSKNLFAWSEILEKGLLCGGV